MYFLPWAIENPASFCLVQVDSRWRAKAPRVLKRYTQYPIGSKHESESVHYLGLDERQELRRASPRV
jgi:hypothetical protein